MTELMPDGGDGAHSKRVSECLSVYPGMFQLDKTGVLVLAIARAIRARYTSRTALTVSNIAGKSVAVTSFFCK